MKDQIKISEEALSELQQILDSFNKEFSKFTADQVNTVPYAGGWTAGQVAQHVNMSVSGFNDMMNGPVKDADRPFDAMVNDLREQFGNLGIKMQSPDFVVPEAKHYDKAEMQQALGNTFKNVLQSAETLPMDKLCVSFELPVVGYLTRREAVAFVAYHTQRHIHQLKKIQKVLASDVAAITE